MSMRAKLEEAARRGVAHERGRVLWLLQSIERDLTIAVGRKLLIESERHAAEVKLKIFKSLAANLRVDIVSGREAPKHSPIIDQHGLPTEAASDRPEDNESAMGKGDSQ